MDKRRQRAYVCGGIWDESGGGWWQICDNLINKVIKNRDGGANKCSGSLNNSSPTELILNIFGIKYCKFSLASPSSHSFPLLPIHAPHWLYIHTPTISEDRPSWETPVYILIWVRKISITCLGVCSMELDETKYGQLGSYLRCQKFGKNHFYAIACMVSWCHQNQFKEIRGTLSFHSDSHVH